jgi:hypothetical protein
MNKYKILFTSLLFLLFINVFGQAPVKQDFDQLASISFPDKPTVSDLPNGMGLLYKSVKSPNSYAMLLFKFKADDIMVTDTTTLRNFYEGVVSGAANPDKAKTLLYTKNISIDNYKGIEFEYKDATTPAQPRFVYQRVLFMKTRAYIYSFSTPDDSNATNKTERDNFFNSFSILDKSVKQY